MVVRRTRRWRQQRRRRQPRRSRLLRARAAQEQAWRGGSEEGGHGVACRQRRDVLTRRTAACEHTAAAAQQHTSTSCAHHAAAAAGAQQQAETAPWEWWQSCCDFARELSLVRALTWRAHRLASFATHPLEGATAVMATLHPTTSRVAAAPARMARVAATAAAPLRAPRGNNISWRQPSAAALRPRSARRARNTAGGAVVCAADTGKVVGIGARRRIIASSSSLAGPWSAFLRLLTLRAPGTCRRPGHHQQRHRCHGGRQGARALTAGHVRARVVEEDPSWASARAK
jgi:hypothetical protein